ncbi:hypothetical protein M5X00_29980 [Paenibacillus alvei]|uniref:Transposase n=1 Tax=Paenibacillus alvei TaxID=44250 RepID=A0ABT4H135_PAEAL|nr:hypothetical protein [Paenibacillus alvei]MCY9543725.1 hypothetical protein [Paenibacillus alvei]MCY9708212.1 hypothetical protein [Paenibacillus alvei]MCY9737920.1 hypothetical protein [Paenibacillus alvei]MCY9758452.1 hypothetical protein [Paenibacillus alvei]MCY9762650.1 hypothetical protein [Paenibacillus alvei]
MYRDELDALNGIYEQQKRIIELLDQLVKKGGEPEDASKGRSGRNTGKGTKQLPVTQVDSKEGNSGT